MGLWGCEMNEWTIAILPIGGAIIGALMHYFFTRDLEIKKQIKILEMQAYSDYLRAVAACAHLGSSEFVGDSPFLDAADAKSRIAVFGSSEVIKALARFEEVGPTLSNDDSITAFIDLISRMRSEKRNFSDHDLELILIGNRP